MIEPYWQSDDGRYTVFHADCLDVLPQLEGIDAVVTDPPYGIAQHTQGGERSKACKAMPRIEVVGDAKPFDPTALLGYHTLCMWGANHYANQLPPVAGWLVWDKREGGTSDGYSDAELAWARPLNSARLFHHKWRGMIKASERDQCRVHPTQKPILLMEWCLDQMKIPADALVADPFMGSGTTGVACVNTGRRFIGIEIDETYAKIAVKRIQDALAQLPLMEAAG